MADATTSVSSSSSESSTITSSDDYTATETVTFTRTFTAEGTTTVTGPATSSGVSTCGPNVTETVTAHDYVIYTVVVTGTPTTETVTAHDYVTLTVTMGDHPSNASFTQGRSNVTASSTGCAMSDSMHPNNTCTFPGASASTSVGNTTTSTINSTPTSTYNFWNGTEIGSVVTTWYTTAYTDSQDAAKATQTLDLSTHTAHTSTISISEPSKNVAASNQGDDVGKYATMLALAVSFALAI